MLESDQVNVMQEDIMQLEISVDNEVHAPTGSLPLFLLCHKLWPLLQRKVLQNLFKCWQKLLVPTEFQFLKLQYSVEIHWNTVTGNSFWDADWPEKHSRHRQNLFTLQIWEWISQEINYWLYPPLAESAYVTAIKIWRYGHLNRWKLLTTLLYCCNHWNKVRLKDKNLQDIWAFQQRYSGSFSEKKHCTYCVYFLWNDWAYLLRM